MTKEIFDILGEYDNIDFTERKAAIATVVNVEGSSYRQPGARMLISDDGRLTGAISGGCLEGDALRKALLVMARGKPALVTYDTTDESDAILGIGLGCNGIIHILIEPIDPSNRTNPVELLRAVTGRRQKSVLVTLFSMQDKSHNKAGTCLAYSEKGILLSSGNFTMPDESLLSLAREALSYQNPIIKTLSFEGNGLIAFADVINPVVSLVIAGAGNDVIPLVKAAGIMAWHITILDGRPSYATCQRFPDVHEVLVTEAQQALSKIAVDDHTVFVLMTHNYNYDLALLRQLIPIKVPYIGVLGPKKKLDRMLRELQNGDGSKAYLRPDHVYGPAGLDIGAETSEEIAISIVAEIKAVLSGKNGKSLRNKTDSIHKPVPEIHGVKEQAEFQP